MKSNNDVKCTLDPKTQELLNFIFDKDMFNSTLADFELGMYLRHSAQGFGDFQTRKLSFGVCFGHFSNPNG